MEKNRFIIGDLVTTSLGIAKILDTYHNGDYYFEGKSFTGQDNNIGPIPLSPTILLKNGWREKIDREMLYWCKDNLSLGRFIKDRFARLRFYYDGKCTRLRISYVHQLQHLLFGLGLESNMEV